MVTLLGNNNNNIIQQFKQIKPKNIVSYYELNVK